MSHNYSVVLNNGIYFFLSVCAADPVLKNGCSVYNALVSADADKIVI